MYLSFNLNHFFPTNLFQRLCHAPDRWENDENTKQMALQCGCHCSGRLRMSCDTCAKAQVTVTKWSCHPARMVLSWDTKGSSTEKNANHPCAALRKTINNGTGDKREHIILSLKDVLFSHKSRNSKSRKSNQTNSLNRRTTWLHTLSKGTRKQNFLSWVNQVIFFPKTMSSFSCHTNCPFNSS